MHCKTHYEADCINGYCRHSSSYWSFDALRWDLSQKQAEKAGWKLKRRAGALDGGNSLGKQGRPRGPPTKSPIASQKNATPAATMAKRAQDTGDASSLSDPNAATFTHLSLTWDVNFDSQQIAATAEYDVKVSTKGADLFLDTKSLAIQEIVVDGTIVANWTLEDGIEVSTSAFINFSSQLFPMQ